MRASQLTFMNAQSKVSYYYAALIKQFNTKSCLILDSDTDF